MIDDAAERLRKRQRDEARASSAQQRTAASSAAAEIRAQVRLCCMLAAAPEQYAVCSRLSHTTTARACGFAEGVVTVHSYEAPCHCLGSNCMLAAAPQQPAMCCMLFHGTRITLLPHKPGRDLHTQHSVASACQAYTALRHMRASSYRECH